MGENVMTVQRIFFNATLVKCFLRGTYMKKKSPRRQMVLKIFVKIFMCVTKCGSLSLHFCTSSAAEVTLVYSAISYTGSTRRTEKMIF